MYLYQGLTLNVAGEFLQLRGPYPYMTDDRKDYVPLFEIMRLGGIPFEYEESDQRVRITGSGERANAQEWIRQVRRSGSMSATGLPEAAQADEKEPVNTAIRLCLQERELPLRHPLCRFGQTIYIAAADLPSIVPQAKLQYNHYDDYLVLAMP